MEEPEEKDDEDEADESLGVNLDEEVTFEFLLGTGLWQTSLRLTYDTVISMDLNPPSPVMRQAYSYKYHDYRHFQKHGTVGQVGQMFWGGGGGGWKDKRQGWKTQNY